MVQTQSNMKDKLSTLEIIMNSEDLCGQEITDNTKMSNDGQDNQRAQPIHCRFYRTTFTSLGHWHDCVRSSFESLVKGIKSDGH